MVSSSESKLGWNVENRPGIYIISYFIYVYIVHIHLSYISYLRKLSYPQSKQFRNKS